MQFRSVLISGLALVVVGAAWFLWRDADRTAQSVIPGASAAAGGSQTPAPNDPSAPTSAVPANVAAADGAAAGAPSERVATDSSVTFRGRTLAQLRGALVDFDASGSIKVSEAVAQDELASPDIAQARRPWIEFLEAKYAEIDEAELARARTEMQALLDWQAQGPFEFDTDRLPKSTVEVLLAEFLWLESR